jgi:hypothetical protein
LGTIAFVYLGLVKSSNSTILALYILETNLIYFKPKDTQYTLLNIFINSIDGVLLVIIMLNPTHILQTVLNIT